MPNGRRPLGGELPAARRIPPTGGHHTGRHLAKQVPLEEPERACSPSAGTRCSEHALRAELGQGDSPDTVGSQAGDVEEGGRWVYGR